jgi:hypothetical protein
MLQWAFVPPRTVMKVSVIFFPARDFLFFFRGLLPQKFFATLGGCAA